MASHDHRIFTLAYRAVSGMGEHSQLGQLRTQVLTGAHGRLLIIGSGPGHDLDHLPDTVTSVVAVEPSPSMRAAAAPRVEAARARGLTVEVIDAMGEDLPLVEDSVDSVLFSYVLCTVISPAAVLAEARRVLRPGGTLCVLEHVRAAPGTRTDRWQRVVSAAGIWPRLTGGCHCRRTTRTALADAGFDVTALTEAPLVNVPVVGWTLVGTTHTSQDRLR